MKHSAAFLVPLGILLCGLYALLTALTSGGEQVELPRDHAPPRGLAIIRGIINQRSPYLLTCCRAVA